MVSESSCPVRERIATVYKLLKINQDPIKYVISNCAAHPEQVLSAMRDPNNRTRERSFAPK